LRPKAKLGMDGMTRLVVHEGTSAGLRLRVLYDGIVGVKHMDSDGTSIGGVGERACRGQANCSPHASLRRSTAS
jgi:hypothetical protein